MFRSGNASFALETRHGNAKRNPEDGNKSSFGKAHYDRRDLLVNLSPQRVEIGIRMVPIVVGLGGDATTRVSIHVNAADRKGPRFQGLEFVMNAWRKGERYEWTIQSVAKRRNRSAAVAVLALATTPPSRQLTDPAGRPVGPGSSRR